MKKLKKPIAFLLAVIMAMMFNFPSGLFPGIGMELTVYAEDNTCNHEWGTEKTGTIDPTCTEGGYDVYACEKCGLEKTEPNDTPATGHNKGEDGKCTNCGAYMISNADELKAFAAAVNGGETSANAVLTANITVNEDVLKADGTLADDVSGFTSWTPIGWYDYEEYVQHYYTGTFDGEGHTISGLYFNDTQTNYVGLFGYVGEGGSVLNVGVVDSYFSGKNSVGGVCGCNFESTIENCYNTGSVSGGDSVGGVCGNSYSGRVTNSYNTGSVSGSGDFVGGVCGQNYGGRVTNCYYLSKTSGSDRKTAAQFKSGEVAYLLSQGGGNGGSVWGQKIGTDDYPVLNGVTVYATTGCVTYNNSGDTSKKDHNYKKGICTDCGGYKEPEKDENDVYQISKATDLYWFAEYVNSGNNSVNAVLTNDITVNEGVLKADGTLADDVSGFTSWMPIGYYNSDSDCSLYTGTFNGQGHTISGLYFNDTNIDSVGLFGYVGTVTDENDNVISAGKVSNVGVVDSYFSGKDGVGGVCGANFEGTIENCYNTGSVSGGEGVGGVCGFNGNTIENCYNTGSVSGSNAVGGVCGINFGSTVENCYNTGSVSGSNAVGGVCGYNEGTITNCYYLSKTSGSDRKTAAQFKSGEVAYLLSQGEGNGGSVWGQNIGTDDYPVLNGDKVYATTGCVTYNNSGDTSPKEHKYEEGICTDCGAYTEPEKDENGVYQISKAADLYWFAEYVNSGNNSVSAVLTNDITVNSDLLSSLEYDTDGNVTNDDGLTYWTPIGYYNSDSDCSYYAGTFDGQGHTISGLYFNDKNINYVGLFGYVGDVGGDGSVSNVGIVDSYFSGEDYVSGVCGYNAGTITSCYNEGTVSGSSNSYYVGGVCGGNSINGTIENCYNTGSVSGSADVGGVCGNNSGTITNCYNEGTVSGSSDSYSVGGVCGATYLGTIENCYNTGSVSGGEGVGGVCGKNDVGTITNCYYLKTVTINNDINAIGNEESDTAGKAESKTTTDFTDGTICGLVKYHSHQNGICIWCGGYEPATLTTDKYDINGDDTPDKVYEISSTGQLYWFAGLVNGDESVCDYDAESNPTGTQQNPSANAVLTADITVNKDVLKADGTLADDVSGFTAWTPIGWYDYEEYVQHYYTGTFDGAGHTISGLYFNDTNIDYVGLFGCVGEGGSVLNVGVVDSYFSGKNSVGGVCGYNFESTIENCYNTGSVSGGGEGVGGVCGKSYSGRVTNSYNTGSVSGSGKYFGGVCGQNYGGTLTNSYNTGSVSGSGDSVGGVCGSNLSGTITNCYYNSDICTAGAVELEDVEGQAVGLTTLQMTAPDALATMNFSSEVWEKKPADTQQKKAFYPSLKAIEDDEPSISYEAEIAFKNTNTNPVYGNDLTFAIEDATVKFAGSKDVISLFADCKAEDFKLLYKGENVCSLSASGSAITGLIKGGVDAGEQTIEVQYVGTDYDIFSGLTSDCTVTIAKAAANEVKSPSATNAIVYGKKLSDVTLSDTNWSWVDGTVVPTVTNSGYKVVKTVTDDDNYDYSVVAGYDAATHTITRTIAVTVTKAAANEVKAPSATNAIVYGKKLSDVTLSDISWSWVDGTVIPMVTNNGYKVVTTVTDYDNYDYSKVAGYDEATHTITRTIAVAVNKAAANEVKAPSTTNAIVYGKKLSDVTLSDTNWSWVDGTVIPTVQNNGYAVVKTVSDDNNYDYSKVAGYDEATHTITRTVDVTVGKATPKVVVTADAETIRAGETVTVSAIAVHPDKEELTDVPAVVITYRIGEGEEQTVTNGAIIVPEDTVSGTAITITATTPATDNYEAGTDTTTVTVKACIHANKTLQHDKDYHWYLCADCGSEIEKAAHISGGAATTEHAEVCTVCGYEIAPKLGMVEDPLFTPASGTIFEENLSVTITCGTDGASIYYTTDGTDPATSGMLYKGAITISASTTIKAVAVKDGMAASSVVTAAYTRKAKPDDPEKPSGEQLQAGDPDGNSKVELADAQMTLKAALKIITLDDRQTKAADVDKNGKVELADAQMILKYALKIINTF